jgi:glutathione synthase/RimK-type ligase-like ATP-grasp enzyme
MIILIGHEREFNFLNLVRAARKLDVECLLFQLRPSEQEWDVEIPMSGDAALINKKTGYKLNASDVNGIWCRTSAFPDKYSPVLSGVSEYSKAYVASEWRVAMGAFFSSADAKWANKPQVIGVAGNRILQMRLAPQFGLKVPAWVAASRSKEINEFASSLPNTAFVVKALNEGAPSDCGEVNSNTIKISDPLVQLAPDDGKIPMLLQKAISARVIIRSYVIGNKVYSAEGVVDLSDPVFLDSRLDLSDTKKYPYIVHILPVHIELALVALARKLDLSYGAADFLLDENGDYWFLEINPSGQWAWIERQTGLPISAEIVNFLSNATTFPDNKIYQNV